MHVPSVSPIRARSWRLRLSLTPALVLLAGCGLFKTEDFVTLPEFSADVMGIPVAGLGVGGTCDPAKSECRPGLDCGADGLCAPAGSLVIGESCVMSSECQPNAFCGPDIGCAYPDDNGLPSYQPGSACVFDQQCKDLLGRSDAFCAMKSEQRCQRAGTGEQGVTCALDRDCAPGLACDYTAGFTGSCQPRGTADFGGECTQNADCYPGLVCGEDNTCITWLQALSYSLQWQGASCDVEDLDNPRIYFELPKSDGTPKTEFYRLPYPNDLRRNHATAGHPLPGRGPLDFDPLARVMTAADTGTPGAGTSPTIFFQFSAPLDFNSVSYGQNGTQANLLFVNVDPTSPRFRDPVGYQWSASDGRTKYLCKNYLTVKSGAGSPLEPNTTYAVILLAGMKTQTGKSFEADKDLIALLAPTKPTDPAYIAAWEAYAPLRGYVADQKIAPATVLGAAQFTTQDPTALIRAAREVAEAADTPTLKDVFVCDGASTGPCTSADDPTRSCGTNSDLIEIQGHISLPTFQQGTRPYLRIEDGGDIKMVGGKPSIEGREDVCFALTLPKSAKPAAGYPVVLYAHGTGGSFRSHVADGTASRLAGLPGGGAATLGIDAPMHGPRRGDSTLSPEVLYFNFGNPAAARGNAVQAVMDYVALTKFVRTFSGALGTASVSFDPAKIGFIGHSQGSTIGPMFAAFEPNIGAFLFSGAGASLVNGLLKKTLPVNIPAGIKAVLREEGSDGHPVLAILQAYFDSIDPANFGRLITRTPPASVTTPHNVMVTYGSGDSYTPNTTTRIFADVLEIPLMKPTLDTDGGQAFGGYPTDRMSDGPFTGNVMVNGIPTTQGLCQYTPADYDGHFVFFRNDKAVKQSMGFFDSFFTTGVATIPAQ